VKDPFEEFLEDAMSGPDFELGHEMRRRLLEAAVAGEAIGGDNVVRMDRADPAEQEAFNWIVGETRATEPLMIRMISDAGFLAKLDGERCFLRMLRQTLVKQAEVVAPAARRRFLPAVALASAAAIALAAGTIFFNQGGNDAVAPIIARNEAAPVKLSAPGPAVAVAAVEDARPVAVASVEEVDTAPEIPSSAPSAIIPQPAAPMLDEAPAVAALTGNGQSIEPDDPLLAEAGGSVFTLRAAAAEVPIQESELALVDTGSDSPVASFSSRGPMWDTGFATGLPGATGPSMALISDRESSIPEPGVALPVVIGMMVLFLRRQRKGKA
jgi:hypothetical protein